jgi:hypothetical protein
VSGAAIISHREIQTARRSTVLTPSDASPIDPLLIPRQVIASFDTQPIATVFGFTPARTRLYVKLPGSPVFT